MNALRYAAGYGYIPLALRKKLSKSRHPSKEHSVMPFRFVR